MRRRSVRAGALVALCLLGALLAFFSTRPVAEGASEVDSPLLGTSPILGTPLQSAVLHTLAGSAVPLSGLRGHVVVLSFFASWCPPCQAEAPALETFAWHLQVAHSPTSLYGVVFDDSDAAAAAFVRSFGLTYPVVVDPGGALASDLAVTAPPVAIVLSPRLRVVAVLDGPVTASQLETVTARAWRRG